ncbi:hypothetical protein GCM10010497_13100 [Streptomyces cinereoruber]|uniref:DUF5302 domain-containing protein n=1 Tax=Streptomyces cinereoruber TaxID=67260 RepID=A0AAV4KC40_9ACTN|nr:MULTISPECIES: hypothetical protein [Streptomyces]AVH93904.1 hypothetical protein C5L38_01530 [Streptomyces sp. WAC00288]KYG51670.1 hypothetical protein AWI43_30195 [Streptomyces sp. WAC04657]MBB4162018.1 hypothetical protein [Streptomyces cinereoruber]MBY8819503.1 hypothetical protein [Streptomyces cinereoruber]NIH63750.1 hypothetical protein [Streptomyces cinereoruber]
MSGPQSREQRRSGKGAATPQDLAELKARQAHRSDERGRGAAHGTDKGEKGGGEGGGTPPDQRPEGS